MREYEKLCHDVLNFQLYLEQWHEFCVIINTKQKNARKYNKIWQMLKLRTWNYPTDIIIIITIIISRWKREEKRIKSAECWNVRIYGFYGYKMDRMANNTLPTFFTILRLSLVFILFVQRWTVALVPSIHVYLVGFCLSKTEKQKKNCWLCCAPCTQYTVHSILVRWILK